MKITMKDYNLQIQIISPWIVEKLDMRAKYNSVLFYDYTEIVKEIFYSFKTDRQFNIFRYCLYTVVQEQVKIKKYHDWFRLESWIIYISPNVLANCLPREIRKTYFKRDNFYEKRIFKVDEFNYHYL